MSHVFTVISCSYDGTSPNNPNPLCWLHGAVDGVPTYWIGVFYQTIMQAFNAGGQAAVQAVLAPILQSALGYATPPFPRGPIYSAVVAPAPAGSNSVSVAAALVPQWTQ
jgi:hypothetical protein